MVSPTAGLEGLPILVVEDEAPIALDLCLVLEDLGRRPVGPAVSVGAASDLLRSNPLLAGAPRLPEPARRARIAGALAAPTAAA